MEAWACAAAACAAWAACAEVSVRWKIWWVSSSPEISPGCVSRVWGLFFFNFSDQVVLLPLVVLTWLHCKMRSRPGDFISEIRTKCHSWHLQNMGIQSMLCGSHKWQHVGWCILVLELWNKRIQHDECSSSLQQLSHWVGSTTSFENVGSCRGTAGIAQGTWELGVVSNVFCFLRIGNTHESFERCHL